MLGEKIIVKQDYLNPNTIFCFKEKAFENVCKMLAILFFASVC